MLTETPDIVQSGAEGVENAVSSATDNDYVQDLKDGVSDVIGDAMDFLPKLALFIIILIIGFFVAKLIGRGVRKLLKKINFDYYVDKAGIGAPLERAGFRDSGRFAGKIVYYLIILLVLKIAFNALQVEALEKPFDELIEWIPKALVALVLIVVGGLIANAVRDIVAGATNGQGYSNFVTKVAFIGVWLIFGLAAVDQMQIAQDLIDTLTTTILASLGAILVIKFGIGGIWAARDHFWPAVYKNISSNSGGKPQAPQTQRPQN